MWEQSGGDIAVPAAVSVAAVVAPCAVTQGSNGATLYDYEYELDSTRGKKRIFNTVTITGARGWVWRRQPSLVGCGVAV
jgi:hypothetical protein